MDCSQWPGRRPGRWRRLVWPSTMRRLMQRPIIVDAGVAGNRHFAGVLGSTSTLADRAAVGGNTGSCISLFVNREPIRHDRREFLGRLGGQLEQIEFADWCPSTLNARPRTQLVAWRPSAAARCSLPWWISSARSLGKTPFRRAHRTRPEWSPVRPDNFGVRRAICPDRFDGYCRESRTTTGKACSSGGRSAWVPITTSTLPYAHLDLALLPWAPIETQT